MTVCEVRMDDGGFGGRRGKGVRARSRDRGRTAAALAAVVLTALPFLSACEWGAGSGSGSGNGAGGGPGSSDGRSVSPFANPDGTKPGLAPLTTDADRARGRALISRLPTKGRGPKTGYRRDRFGYAWLDTADGIPLAHNGCDTRNDLLARDGQEVRLRSGSDCVVVSMTLHDPYTGKDLHWKKRRAATVQIDHMVPLSYSWQMGSARWPVAKRRQLANDPLNLLPVDGPSNSSKGDSGPASWLPPSSAIRCAYAVRFAQVALKYQLPVTAPDKRAMTVQCGG